MDMKVATIHGRDDVRLDEVPEPEPGPDDVLVRVAACGICGSDLGYVAAGGLGGPGGRMPLGHEIAGVVERVGAAVRGVAPGAHVIVNPMAAGNNIGNGGSEGGLAPFVLVRNAGRDAGVLPIPASVPLERAALAEPLAVALHAVNRATLRPSDRVVVLGAGSIGLGVVYWLAPARRAGRGGGRPFARAARARARARGPRGVRPAGPFTPRHARGGPRQQQRLRWPVVQSDVYLDTAGAAALIGDVVAVARAGARLVVVAVHHAPVAVDFRCCSRKSSPSRRRSATPTSSPT
jgi:threonine dehydrogenase-like Zn-dependent dehydrogenase